MALRVVGSIGRTDASPAFAFIRILSAAVLLTSLCAGEIIDRIAASIGSEVITDHQVRQQLRLAAFLNGSPVDMGAESKREMLDRMINQALIRREIEFTRFPAATSSDAAALLKEIRERYHSDSEFEAALQHYGITREQLQRQLIWQLTFLRFVEYRFRPSVHVTETEIVQEYRRELAQRTAPGPAPSLEEMRPELEKRVRQQLTDSALDRWLGETRTQVDIFYHDGYKL
jgi:hypothetical protein